MIARKQFVRGIEESIEGVASCSMFPEESDARLKYWYRVRCFQANEIGQRNRAWDGSAVENETPNECRKLFVQCTR